MALIIEKYCKAKNDIMLISHGINDVKRGLGNKEICTHDIKTNQPLFKLSRPQGQIMDVK